MKNKIVYDGRTFTPADIKSGGIHLAASLPSMQLEANTFTAIVKSDDTTLTQFTRNTPLEYYHKDRLICITYLQTVDRVGPNKYKFYGTSAIGRLIEQPHAGGIYTGQTAEEVITDICGGLPVIIKTSLKGIALYGWLPYAKPPKRSARDNLVQVLFALGASLDTDLDGVLRVVPLFDGVSNAVDKNRIYQGAGVFYDTPVSAVSVTEHQYIAGGDEDTLFEGTTEDGHLVTFDKPHSDLSAVGFTVQDSGANWARLSAGAGTLSGKAYIHTTRLVTETVTAGAAENVKSITDCTLVSLLNSGAVARRMASYYRCTERIQAPILVGTERPGQMVSIYNPFDKTAQTGCIASMDVTMSGVLKGETDILVGFIPPQPGSVEILDAQELLTEDGEYQFPDGVTEAVAVIGGGGFGGWSGLRGQEMSYPPPTTSVQDSGYTWHGYNAGYGALGGEGGHPGSGGKVLQVNISIEPGQKFRVKIGKGGKGGVYSDAGSVEGSPGEATLFGDYSSDDGGVIPGGYTDLLTGSVYSKPADRAGKAGGKGSGLPSGSSVGWELGTTVTDYDGNVWEPGPVPTVGDNVVVWYQAQAGKGSGGGAAVGANGHSGSMGHVSRMLQRYNAIGGASGNGADAVKPAKQTRRGWGGDGGHGGGGEGGTGTAAVVGNTNQYYVDRGRPGHGSDGGDGGDGYVLLYFRRARSIGTGQLLTADHRFSYDRLGRIFAV